LYFFLQLGQALCPKGILALQNMQAAGKLSAFRVSNDENGSRLLLNLVAAFYIGEMRIFGRFGVL
jgi:hypothetical protein